MTALARRHPALVEFTFVGVALGAVAAFVYGGYAIQGGFLSDAWSFLAIHQQAGNVSFPTLVERFLVEASQQPRPLNAVYLASLSEVFGVHSGFWIAWLGAMNVLMSLSLYALLRELRMERLDAAVIAGLVLMFPAATSLRLWTAVAHIPLALAIAMAGFVAALRAFDAVGSLRLVLHGVSLALFAASLLLYEAALPIMLASVLLYRLHVPFERSARRWLVDCAVLLPLVALVTRSSSASQQTQSWEGAWGHAVVMWEHSRALLITMVMPLGTDGWQVVALVGLIPALALLVRGRLPPEDPARVALSRWLVALLGGVLTVALGYAIFVPAMDYYAPLNTGIGNRINAVPSIGWTLIVYSIVAMAATVAMRSLSRAKIVTSGLTVVASALVAVGWLQAVARDADAYQRAYVEGQRVLGAVSTAIPDPRPSSTIWTFGQPVEISPGIPVFGNTWDMTSSIQLKYDDRSLVSYVAYPGTAFDCLRTRVVAGGLYATDDPTSPGAYASSYGFTYFVETTTGRSLRIDSQQQCRQAVASFPPSPWHSQ